MLACNCFKCRIDLAAIVCFEDLRVNAVRSRGSLDFPNYRFGIRLVSWIDEHSYPRSAGLHLVQKLKLLYRQLGVEEVDACQIALRTRKAADETELHRILGCEKYDRDFSCRRLSSKSYRSTPAGDNYINLPVH